MDTNKNELLKMAKIAQNLCNVISNYPVSSSSSTSAKIQLNYKCIDIESFGLSISDSEIIIDEVTTNFIAAAISYDICNGDQNSFEALKDAIDIFIADCEK